MQTEWNKLDVMSVDPTTGEPTLVLMKLKVDPSTKLILDYEIRLRGELDSHG